MIDINNLSIQFAGKYLFEKVNLKILPTDRIALVGSNGTGKSTFLKILTGKQNKEDGKIQFRKGLKIGYLPQELSLLSNNTIFNEVRNSLDTIVKIDEEETELNFKLEDASISNDIHEKLIHQLGNLNSRKEENGYYEMDAKIEKILMGLGFSPKSFGQKISELSGGWQMRIELAKILTSGNDIILLDEPTNHLDIDSLQWLVKFLRSFKGAIILVSHDRYFVNNICNKTLEIFNNNVTFYKGNYNDYLDFKTERAIRLKSEYNDQQKKIKQTEKFIERFRYKNTKAKQVQSRVKQLEKIETIQLTDDESKIHFKFFDSQSSGVIPITVTDLSKSYDSNLVFNNLNLQIERGEKIALIGPNGAGKTTFSKIISKRLEPTSGTVEFGYNTIISFYAQDVVDNLNMENDIITELSTSDPDNTIGQLRSILGAFLFQGDDVFKKIEVLSGGEKSRVALAKVLLTKANTIILDEPTNHLDFDSKRIVQKALMEFKGTLIIVSHDIDFLRPIATKVIEVRNQTIKEFYGGIDYYLSKRNEESYNTVKINKNDTPPKINNRKEEKRIQAEKRQKSHISTKKLKKTILDLEIIIEKLESTKINLEEDLGKEEVYSNNVLARQNKIEYEKTKHELEKAYSDWTNASDNLENIKDQL